MCKKGKIDWSLAGDGSITGGMLLVAQQTKLDLSHREMVKHSPFILQIKH